MNFTELPLKTDLLKAVHELGFEQPTPIQEKTIPAILDSPRDLIGLAQTGTGKTAAFGLPILNHIDLNNRSVQALILSPTRELGVQITNDLINYSKYSKGIKITAVYGGASIINQIKDLKAGCQIVVGTPGRTLDLIRRKVLKPQNIKYLVLDEADEMLNMGFKEELDAILNETPETKQTLLFSATMPSEIREISKKYMTDALEISVGKKNIGAVNVSHLYYVTAARNKYLALKRIVDVNPKIYGIIFCRTRRETKEIADKLMQDGYDADALHGDLSQSQRDFVMNRFRLKRLQLLVATDVAARGLDVDNLTHVINYNLPDEAEAYIHRSGRTGRAGKTGLSVSIIHSRENHKIRVLERLVGQKFEHKLIPNGHEICEKQLFNLINNMENIRVDNKQIDQFMPMIYKKLEWLTREDLIQRFVSVEFNRFLEYYKDTGDINVSVKSAGSSIRDENKPKRRDSRRDSRRDERFDNRRDNRRDERHDDKRFSRFFINVGSKDGLTAPVMIGLINDFSRRRDLKIGRIDLMKKFSFFEVDKDYESLILKSFKGKYFNKTKLTVEISQPDTKGNTDSGNSRKRRKQKS